MEKIRQCNKCDVELVVGENITPSRFKNSHYKCSLCMKSEQAKYYQDNKELVNKKNMQYKKDNPEKVKQYHNKAIKKIRKKIPAGVYGIIENKKLIYIGSSKQPYRRMIEHFSKSGSNNSSISPAIESGELKREDLSFIMLEHINDTDDRLKRERELIRSQKPKYNQALC